MADTIAPIPSTMRQLRACLVCAVIQTQSSFVSRGCPNCDFLELAQNPDSVAECTSAVFEGSIALADPKGSWVAKWQRLDGYLPGIYAVKVVGRLSEDRKGDAMVAGINYFP
jgi:transcription elongation factor SPT4